MSTDPEHCPSPPVKAMFYMYTYLNNKQTLQ